MLVTSNFPLNQNLKDYVLIASYDSPPISIGANNAKDISIPTNQIDGYKPIACVGFRNNKANSIFVSQSALYLTSGDNIGAWCYNASGNSYDEVVITAYVLYIRDI